MPTSNRKLLKRDFLVFTEMALEEVLEICANAIGQMAQLSFVKALAEELMIIRCLGLPGHNRD